MKKKSQQELIIFLGLMLLGSILRIWALDLYPRGFHGDEAWTGLEARRILQEGYIGFWSPAALGQTVLPFYWTALIFKLFGESVFSTRLSFALLNVFSLPFFYLAVRILFSRGIAIISTFLLSTGSVSLALSRRADYVAANFSFFPALFFFLLAIRTNKKLYFALAGIFLGLSHHMYFALWVTSIIFAVLVIFNIFTSFFNPEKKGGVKNWIIFFIFYLLIAFPMLLFAFKHKEMFFSRMKTVSVLSEQEKFPTNGYFIKKTNIAHLLRHNLKVTLLMFNFKEDPDIWSTFTHKPVFNVFTGILFLTGLILGIRYFKKEQFFFLYFPFLFFLTGSIFTIDAPNLRRSQISIYLAYVFVAFGIVTSYKLLSKSSRFIQKALLVLGIPTLIFLSFYDTSLYFRKYSVSLETRYAIADRLVQVANFLKTLPKPIHIYFYSSCCPYQHQTLQFLLPDIPGEDRSREFGQYSLAPNHQDKNVIYIFLEGYLDTLSQVELLYPGGQKTEYRDVDGKILFTTYFLNS